MKSNILLLPLVLTWLIGVDQVGAQTKDHSQLQSQYAELVNRVQKRYQSLTTYQDSGSVTTVFDRNGKVWSNVKPFKIAFERKVGFRFEYWDQDLASQSLSYIVHRDDQGRVSSWWGLKDELRKSRNLPLMLAGPTGISGGSAITIPRLLMVNELRFARKKFNILNRMGSVTSISVAQLDGKDCFKVEGMIYDDPGALWIDQESLMLVQIETSNVFDDFTTKSTMVVYPRVDAQIRPESLAFNVLK